MVQGLSVISLLVPNTLHLAFRPIALVIWRDHTLLLNHHSACGLLWCQNPVDNAINTSGSVIFTTLAEQTA